MCIIYLTIKINMRKFNMYAYTSTLHPRPQQFSHIEDTLAEILYYSLIF